MRTVLDGGSATSPSGAHYRFNDLRQEPVPVQKKLPIMIGGAGERKTLRTVAKYADMWNMSGTPERVKHKVAVLDQHCQDVGRDPAEIERTISCKLFLRDSEADARQLLKRTMERNQTPMSEVEDDVTFWVDTPERTVERLLEYGDLGITTFIPEIPAPYDDETLTRLVREVKPAVERAA